MALSSSGPGSHEEWSLSVSDAKPSCTFVDPCFLRRVFENIY